MRFRHVCLESIGYVLPKEIVTSDEIERRLKPLYGRLRLPAGRLELMTGIRERRVWDVGVLPGSVSVESARAALKSAEVKPPQIGALIHASVCRDHLEPATACRVHHELGLDATCLVYDVSNACLGLLNGVLQIAHMIELGHIQAGMVVGTEGSRALLETTIGMLNRDGEITRDQVKLAIASLTIGSASCALLLTHGKISQSQSRVLAACARAESAHHRLCHSGCDEGAGPEMRPLMETDSEHLMARGIVAGASTFHSFLEAVNWSRDDLDATICHQVTATHRKKMLEALGLPESKDFATFAWLGNTGSAALPVTLALAAEEGRVVPGNRVGLLGIGSGINCLMLAVEWNESRTARGATP